MENNDWHLFKDENPPIEDYSRVYWVTVRQKKLGVISTRKMRWRGKWEWMNGTIVTE